MRTIKKWMFFFAIIAVMISYNFGEVSTSSIEDAKPKTENNFSNKTTSSKKNSLCPSPCLENISAELFNADDYAGSFLIEQNSEFQSVYSSQNYGTFYQIYCRAKFYTDTADNEKYVDSLEFRIINYKGPLDIGFSQRIDADDEEDNQISAVKYEDTVIVMKAVVRGGSRMNSLKFDVRDKNIKKGIAKNLIVYRMLIPLSDDGQALSGDGIFDSEFFARSGLSKPTNKRLVPGLAGYHKDSLGGFNMNDTLTKNDLEHFAEGKDCYSSSNLLKWE